MESVFLLRSRPRVKGTTQKEHMLLHPGVWQARNAGGGVSRLGSYLFTRLGRAVPRMTETKAEGEGRDWDNTRRTYRRVCM